MISPKNFMLLLCAIGAVAAQAQQFKPVQENPFGINTAPYSYNDMQFADLTLDGAFDIIFNDAEFTDGPFILFNKGSLGAPDFTNSPYLDYLDEDENGQGFGTFTGPGDMYYDVDNDGDNDLIYPYPSDEPGLDGNYFIEYNEQEGTQGQYLFFFLGASADGSELGLPTMPLGITETSAIGDLDGDGDDDILGFRIDDNTEVSNFYFYENTTNTPVLFFNGIAVEGAFGLPSGLLGYDNYGYPALIDADLDGDLDLLVSLSAGNWRYYENTGTALVPVFAAGVENPFGLTSLPEAGQVHAIDVNNDGKTDVIVGAEDKVYYFENQSTSASQQPVWEVALSLSPNPVQHQLTISTEQEPIASVSLVDAMGRVVKQVSAVGAPQLVLDVQTLPDGVYSAKVENQQGRVQVRRFVKG
jgi:hypothetical protein